MEGDTEERVVMGEFALALSGKELPMTSTSSTEEGDPPD
jgi:hypothetical protein